MQKGQTEKQGYLGIPVFPYWFRLYPHAFYGKRLIIPLPVPAVLSRNFQVLSFEYSLLCLN